MLIYLTGPTLSLSLSVLLSRQRASRYRHPLCQSHVILVGQSSLYSDSQM